MKRWKNEAVVCSCTCACSHRSAGSVEWFAPAPKLTHTVTDAGFLALEVECKYQSLKRHVTGSDDATTSSDDDDDYDVSDDDDLDLISRSARYVKHGLYYVTDIERFQPPRKKPRLVTRTYRLLGLKSTTPEELFTRKVGRSLTDEQRGCNRRPNAYM